MGTCCSSHSHQLNQAIDLELQDAKTNSQREIRILLLGCKGSGKKTFMKQMQMIHGSGYGAQQRMECLTHIHRQIICKLQAILMRSGRSLTEFSSECQNAAECVMQADPLNDQLDEKLAACMKTIWSEPRISDVCIANETHDSLRYFMDCIDRISDPDYVPNDRDILMMDATTHKTMELSVRINDTMFKFINPCEQQSSYRKYMHCFDSFTSVTAVIFIASLSCYDVKMQEHHKEMVVHTYVEQHYADIDTVPNDLLDLIAAFCDLEDARNMMKQQMDLFEDICNDRYFRRSSIILFLNKTDVFETKLRTIPFVTDEETDFPGDPHSYEETLEYIRNSFHSLDRDHQHMRQIYTHVTCNIDRRNVEIVFNDIYHLSRPYRMPRGGLL